MISGFVFLAQAAMDTLVRNFSSVIIGLSKPSLRLMIVAFGDEWNQIIY